MLAQRQEIGEFTYYTSEDMDVARKLMLSMLNIMVDKSTYDRYKKFEFVYTKEELEWKLGRTLDEDGMFNFMNEVTRQMKLEPEIEDVVHVYVKTNNLVDMKHKLKVTVK